MLKIYIIEMSLKKKYQITVASANGLMNNVTQVNTNTRVYELHVNKGQPYHGVMCRITLDVNHMFTICDNSSRRSTL